MPIIKQRQRFLPSKYRSEIRGAYVRPENNPDRPTPKQIRQKYFDDPATACIMSRLESEQYKIDEFVLLCNTLDNRRDVADALDYTPDYVTSKTSTLRARGYNIKQFKNEVRRSK